MQRADTGEICPPTLQLRVGVRHRVQPGLAHVRVRLALGAENVKFLLQQRIHGGVQVKGETLGAANAQAPLKVEAARAFLEQLDARTAEREGFVGRGIE